MTVIKHGDVTVSYQHTGFIERAGIKTGHVGVAVLRALLDHANHDTRVCFPSIETISARTSLSETSVKKGLRKLEDAGFIETSKRNVEGGRQISNEYRIRDRELVCDAGPLLMIRVLKGLGRGHADRNPKGGEGSPRAPLELNDVESLKALESKAHRPNGLSAYDSSLDATALGSDTQGQEGARETGNGSVQGNDQGNVQGQGNDYIHIQIVKSQALRRTTRGVWIPRDYDENSNVELLDALIAGCQGRTANGVKATATTKPTTTATSKAQATSTAGSPAPQKPPPPRVAAEPPAADTEPRSVADPSLGSGDAAKGPQRPRKRAPRESDPFFHLFGELVLRGEPTSRTRGLAGEFASRCVKNGVVERALRDWREDLTRTGDAKFLRAYNAWDMFVTWWEKRIGKYVQHPSGQSELERSLGAGQGEKWASFRYGVPRE